MIILGITLGVVGLIGFAGIRIVRPTHKMLIETLGKYKRTVGDGFHWIFPIIQMYLLKQFKQRIS